MEHTDDTPHRTSPAANRWRPDAAAASPAAGDIDTVRGYIDQDQLDDAWLPSIPLVPAEQAISDWLNGSAGRPSRSPPGYLWRPVAELVIQALRDGRARDRRPMNGTEDSAAGGRFGYVREP